MLAGALALGIGLALSWQGIRYELRRAPRWAFVLLIAAILGTVVIFVLISIAADRAVSINRAFAMEPGQDMRSRGLPTVLAMIAAYFPAGTGFGSFDHMFRMHEPVELLKRTYFNHAHNDFIEIVLDGGLPGLLLLFTALAWWAFASIRVWRTGATAGYTLPKLGSAMLLLVLVASVFDYPARTPMMMAMIVIAAVWLSQGATAVARAALREQDQHL
jgi:O-antigen ligase